jgi:serine/threonine-protein kinase RsbW
MKGVSPRDCKIEMMLPATPEAVEEFYAEVRRETAERLGISQSFAAELLAREALTNAVVHGCHSDPRQTIRCRLRVRGRRFTIAIAHSGEGFDWRSQRGNIAELSDSSGRGMQILLRYSTRVRYNDCGNAVTIFKQC